MAIDDADFRFDEYSEPFQQAIELIRTWPFPDNMEAQLRRLEKRVPPNERNQFGDIWEMYQVQRLDL